MATKKTSSKKTSTNKKVADTTKKITEGVAKAEATVDETINKVTWKAKEVVWAANTQKVKDLANQADALAGKVGAFAEKADDLAQGVLPSSNWSDAELELEYEEKVSRLFFLRFLWLIIEYWIILVRSIWIGLISIIHFFYMIILGKRNKNLWDQTYRYLRHVTKRGMYIKWVTDKRPEFITPSK